MPSDLKEKMYLNQHDVELCIKTIIEGLVVSKADIFAVIAIGRGGLIPAAMITYQYGLQYSNRPRFELIYAHSYNELQRGQLGVDWPAGITMGGLYHMHERVLIVDDIADSGNTLKAFQKELPRAQTATLVYKETSSVKPDFFGHTDKDGDKYWYVMPWEKR